MAFSALAYAVALFVTVYGVIFLWLSYNEQMGSVKTFLTVLGSSYIVLAHFAVLVALGNGLAYTNQAPCENVVNSSTYNDGANTTAYTYVDSCTGRSVPESSDILVSSFIYIFGAALIIGSLGLLFVGLRSWLFKW